MTSKPNFYYIVYDDMIQYDMMYDIIHTQTYDDILFIDKLIDRCGLHTFTYFGCICDDIL